MVRSLIVLLLSLCITCRAAAAEQPVDKQTSREQKNQQKAQNKRARQEIRYYENLRNEAILTFARENQPSQIRTPFGSDLRITNIVCAGDKISGAVVVHFEITPLRRNIRIFMGAERNGTQAVVDDTYYQPQDLYGRIYTLRPGIPEQVNVLFYGVKPGTDALTRVNISMGLAQNVMNLITFQHLPIIWTDSDKRISSYVKETATNANAN